MKKILSIAGSLAVFVAIVLGVFIAVFDVGKFRPQIEEAAASLTGREVKLEGPVKLGVSWGGGLKLFVAGVSVANPEWAVRPVMAKIGVLELGVALPSLLRNRLEISSLKIKNADVQLETGPDGRSNWDIKLKGAAEHTSAVKSAGKKPEGKKQSLALRIDNVEVVDSHLSIRGKEGKTDECMIKSLSFSSRNNNAMVSFEGEYGGKPVAVNLLGLKPVETVMKAGWPFEAVIKYEPFTIAAKGTLEAAAKKAALEKYEIKTGRSEISGAVGIDYDGVRPAVHGTMKSELLDMADFRSPDVKGGKEAVQAVSAAEEKGDNGEKRIFSRKPFDFSALKSIDAKLEIAIDEMPVGSAAIRNIKTRLNLADGLLLLSPFGADVAGTRAEGQLKLDAGKIPARFSAILKAYQLDLAQFVNIGGLKSFIEGKGDADMDISTFGGSMHDFAANAEGRINLVAAGGSVSERILSEIAGSLLRLFAPGAGGLVKPELNCMAAHLKITEGRVEAEGLLLDAGQATIAGSGGVNLRDETIDMVLYSRMKGVEEINALMPPLRIKGSLRNPGYYPDAQAAARKAAGMLAGFAQAGVPELIHQAGQNSCEHTLRNPVKIKPAPLPAPVEKAVEKARSKVKEIGGKVLEGLGGLLGK